MVRGWVKTFINKQLCLLFLNHNDNRNFKNDPVHFFIHTHWLQANRSQVRMVTFSRHSNTFVFTFVHLSGQNHQSCVNFLTGSFLKFLLSLWFKKSKLFFFNKSLHPTTNHEWQKGFCVIIHIFWEKAKKLEILLGGVSNFIYAYFPITVQQLVEQLVRLWTL